MPNRILTPDEFFAGVLKLAEPYAKEAGMAPAVFVVAALGGSVFDLAPGDLNAKPPSDPVLAAEWQRDGEFLQDREWTPEQVAEMRARRPD